MGTYQEPDWHVQVNCFYRRFERLALLIAFPQLHRSHSTTDQGLAEKAHIYMTADGRISMAGLNGNNIDYFSESVSKAVKGEL